ncbi:MAG: dTDP-glucose 4,6-dehydratase [Muribaculaceae bacterium]|nr:dTDP-glucose 4,6-dehydratase [Muribaculaceae bacterium]
MKTYLVTGAAGFIGCNFVKYVLRRYTDDIKVVIVDALTYAGNPISIKDEIENDVRVTFVHGNITDSALIASLLNEYDVDYVVNFAAESHVDRSIEDPKLFFETNVMGTQNMLECARSAWFVGKDEQGRRCYCPGKKYLQISTDEVYGSLSKDFTEPQALPLTPDVEHVVGNRTDLHTYGRRFFTEDTPLAPRSPYSASKASADLIAMAYYETFGLPVNITRCSNNYGPYHFPEKLIPLVIKNILEGRRLPVYGKGENVRDWLYVEDHCKAIDLVLRRGKVGEVYNVGGFNEESNINIVRLIISSIARIMREEPQFQQLLKGDVADVNDSLIDFVADRPGHDMRYAIDPSKIARELGWYPETSFVEGIEKTIRWNLEHQDWVRSVTSGEYQQYYSRMYGNR